MNEIEDKKIESLLTDFETNHSEFQMRNFIIGSEIHPWHQYKQGLREIKLRFEQLKEKKKRIESVIEKKEKIKKSIFRFRKKNILKLKSLESVELKESRSIESIEKELKCFYKIVTEIVSKHGFDKLTTEKKRFLETEAWREKAKYMLCMDLFCTGRPSKQTVDFVYKLPKSIKKELFISVNPKDEKKIIEYLID